MRKRERTRSEHSVTPRNWIENKINKNEREEKKRDEEQQEKKSSR